MPTKITEILAHFIPCEVCGNKNIKTFGLKVHQHEGSAPYVKCGECETEFYSRRAREVITRAEYARKGTPILPGSDLPKKCHRSAYENEEKKGYTSVEPMSHDSTNIDLPEIHKRYNTPFLKTVRSLCNYC